MPGDVIGGQRLLQPVDVVGGQLAAEPQRVRLVQALVGVDHDPHPGTDRLADRGDPVELFLKGARPTKQLDRGKALPDVGAGGLDQLLEAHRGHAVQAAVGRDLVAVGAQQPVQGQPARRARRSQTAMSTADSAGTATPRPRRWVRAHSPCQRRSHPLQLAANGGLTDDAVDQGAHRRRAAADREGEPGSDPPSPSVTVTCTTSRVTPKPAHRVPVGTRSKVASRPVIRVPVRLSPRRWLGAWSIREPSSAEGGAVWWLTGWMSRKGLCPQVPMARVSLGGPSTLIRPWARACGIEIQPMCHLASHSEVVVTTSSRGTRGSSGTPRCGHAPAPSRIGSCAPGR